MVMQADYMLPPFRGLRQPSAILAAAAILFLGIWLARLAFRRPKTYFWRDDLDLLRTPRKDKIDGVAVICGGSIAGILAARVCVDSFSEVILVDPNFSKSAENKTENAKHGQTHSYLVSFSEVAKALWPTYMDEVIKMGGLIGSADYNLHFDDTRIMFPTAEHTVGFLTRSVFMERPKLERALRKLLLAEQLPNLRVMDGAVSGLVPFADKSRLKSVTVQLDSGKDLTIDDISLFIDCTGTAQAGWKWLQAADYKLPDSLRTTYDSKMRYLTITFTVPDEVKPQLPIPGGYDSHHCFYVYFPHFPESPSFYLLKRGESQVDICLGFRGSWNIPKNVEDVNALILFIDAHKAHGLPAWVIKTIEHLCSQCEPVFKPMRLSPCTHLRYGSLPNLPSNFIAMGDASMALSPVYGQGCTKAAMEAVSLHSLLVSSHLDRGRLPNTFSRTYFETSGPQLQDIWDSNKFIDYGYSTTVPTQGESRTQGRFVRWFKDQAQ